LFHIQALGHGVDVFFDNFLELKHEDTHSWAIPVMSERENKRGKKIDKVFHDKVIEIYIVNVDL
jgi:hypothetical protein